jgi:hypothetical protein
MEQAFSGANAACHGRGTFTGSQLDSTYRRRNECTLVSTSDVGSTSHEQKLVRINWVKITSWRTFTLQYRYDMSSVFCLLR